MTEERATIKSELRRRMLDSRGDLHDAQRRRLDRQICAHILRFLSDRDVIHIAGFVSHAGEPDLMQVLDVLHHAGRRIFLPVIDKANAMSFHRWRPEQDMKPNRFGIPEPTARDDDCPPRQLEVVFTPLVAFSPTGTRLGMGLGFYDRAFNFLNEAPESGPLLVGVAYSLQEVNSLPAENWDVPLAGVVTESGLRMFRE